MKKTIIVIILIIVSIALGYAYEQASLAWQKRQHPIPAEFEQYVMKYSGVYNVPPCIILSVMKAESSFRSHVVSPAGARGLMQIMPETFQWLQTKTGGNHEDGMLFDPRTNIRYGTFFLSYLYNIFADWDLTFAAYNAGHNRVRNQWLNNPEIVQNGKLIVAAIPIEETRNYVIRVNRNIEMYRKLYFS